MEPQLHEQEIWDRVSAAGRALSGEQPPGAIAPELEDAIQSVQDRTRLLRRVTGQAACSSAHRLLALQRREMTGLYVFLTGQRPTGKQAVPIPCLSRTEALRRLLRGTELSAGRLEALSAHATGETRETLLNLAQREQTLFRQLLGIL